MGVSSVVHTDNRNTINTNSNTNTNISNLRPSTSSHFGNTTSIMLL